MAAQIAKLVFKVPQVIARLYDPARDDTYHALGLMETICPTVMASDKIHDIILGGGLEK
jgi:trk system potassium uptake protein TrkA